MSAPRRALVVIDVQNDYFDGPLEIGYPPREDSLARIVDAMDAAAEHGLPVVVVRHESGEGAPVFAPGSAGQALHPDVEKRTTEAVKQVTKRNASVFSGTVADGRALPSGDLGTSAVQGRAVHGPTGKTPPAGRGPS